MTTRGARAGALIAGGSILGIAAARVPIVAVAALAVPALLFAPSTWLLVGGLLLFKDLVPAVSEALSPFTGGDVFLAAWVARVLPTTRRFRLDGSERWLALFLLWAWATTVANGVSPSPLTRISLYALAGLLLTRAARSHRQALLFGVLAYTAVEMALTVTQLPSERIIGTSIGDPHQFGSLLLAALAILLGTTRRAKPSVRIGIGLCLLWVAATRTRGILLALLVLVTLASLRRLRRRQAIIAVVVAATAGLTLYGPLTERFGLNPQSADVRKASITNGIATAMKAPIIGRGWAWNAGRTDLPPNQREAAYNLMVNVWVALGVVGLALLAGYLAALFRELARDRTAFLFCAAMMGLGLTEMIFYAGSFPTVLFFLITGLRDRAEGESEVPASSSRPALSGRWNPKPAR